MINFSISTSEDVPQIVEWTQHDPYHFHQDQPEWWLTGNGVLAFCLMDEHGPLCYVRLDEEGEYIRIHTQFAPRSVVSKERLKEGMIEAIKKLNLLYSQQQGVKGFVFNSVSPTLIAFMKSQDFEPAGNDDYRQDFKDN